jgi:hypothetical protein
MLLALLLASKCDAPEVLSLPVEQQAAACALLDSAGTALPQQVPLDEVLARPEFSGSRHRSGVTLKVLLSRLQAWVESLFETSGAATYSNVTRVVVLALAVLVAGWAMARARQRSKRLPQRSSLGPEELSLQDPREHLAQANALLDTDAREAIRQGLYALLSTLERRSWARPDRVKTNRELAAELHERGAPEELSATVTRMLEWYDRAFYSKAAVTRSEASQFIEAVGAIAPLG